MTYTKLNLKDGAKLTEKHLAHFESGIAAASESPDWNRNDATKPDYIKGRTHWKEYVGENRVIIPEMDAVFLAENNGHLSVDGVEYGFIEGHTYVVSWQGVEYECVCKAGNNGSVYVGNYENFDGGVDTGEPFTIVAYPYDIERGSYTLYKGYATPETIHVKVDEKQTVVYHKLDKNFLPDYLQFGYEETDLLSETELTFEDMDGLFGTVVELNTNPVTGNTYTVKYNGIVYECVAVDPVGDGSTTSLGNAGIFGDTDTGEPFLLYGEQGMFLMIPGDGATSAVVSISGNVMVPIPAEYAPAAIMLDLIELGIGTITSTELIEQSFETHIEPILKMAVTQGGLNVRFSANYRYNDPTYLDSIFMRSAVAEEMIVSATIQEYDGVYRIQALLYGAVLYIQAVDQSINAVIRPIAFNTST